MIERTDVAYVGRIRTRFMIVLQEINTDESIDPVYQLGILNNNAIQFSAGAFTEFLVGDGDPPYEIAYFEAISTSSGWEFEIFDSDGASRGYMTSSPNEFHDLTSTIREPERDYFTLTSTDPSGYGRNELLAGVRYSITSRTYGSNISYVVHPFDAEITNDPNLDGLRRYNSSTSSHWASNGLISLIPVTMASWYNTPPTEYGYLPPTVRISQCVNMADTGFGTSTYCSNWRDNRGFTISEDIRDVIYFYSRDGTCGQAYSFTDSLGFPIDVTSSIGNCSDNICDYADSAFFCSDDPATAIPEELPPPAPSTSEPIPVEADEDRFLNWRTVIMIGIIVIILIILFAAIIGGIIYVSRSKSSAQSTASTSVNSAIYA